MRSEFSLNSDGSGVINLVINLINLAINVINLVINVINLAINVINLAINVINLVINVINLVIQIKKTELSKFEILYNENNNKIIKIIIDDDFLPRSSRGSHVMSDFALTNNQYKRLSPYLVPVP